MRPPLRESRGLMTSTSSRKTEQSRRLQQRAESMIPGGVNSPVREGFAHLGRGRE